VVLSYKTGAAGAAAGAMAEYLGGSKDVPEMAAKLATYLGDAYALNVTAGTAALPMLDMHPLIADLLAIDTTRSLTQEEMTHLLAGKTALGDPIPGKEIQASTKNKTRLAFADFTFSAPKSLSISIALAPDGREAIVLETAFMRANNDLMKHIEREVGGVRHGRGGRLGVDPGHMAVVQYHHATARPTKKTADGQDTKLTHGRKEEMRPGDMQRHIHNVFLHATVSDSGDVRAPDLNTTNGRILEWGAIGHAYLISHLKAAGVRAEVDPRTGLSHLPDVPEAMVDLFSTRTRQGEAMARAKAGKDFDNLSPEDRIRLRQGQVKSGRQAKEDMSELAFWKQTAAEVGYVHKSVINPENRQGLLPEAERGRIAYEAGLVQLEPELERRSKLDGPTIRYAAAKGFIASGIERPDEVETVLSAFMTEGVRQRGEMVQMIAGREHGERFTSATTSLHVAEEREAISSLQSAVADTSAALTHQQIDAAIARLSAEKGYDFTTPAGLGQHKMADTLSTYGRAAIGIGWSGAGKTVSLEAVIDAHHEAGWSSYGATLAWRQTHGLKDAGVGRKKQRHSLIPDKRDLVSTGIDAERVYAMAPFLKAVETGILTLDSRTLVVVDEVGTIDTRQILQLARAQKEHGFKLIAIGDNEQCQSVGAGNTVALFRHVFGPEQLPELLDTVRQRRIEDRETAKMLRTGHADLALPRKEARGLLQLVPGDYEDAIKAGVDWLEKRQSDHADREKYKVGVSVPTNADVLAFGLEYRTRQRAAGKLSGDDWTIEATDQNGVQHDLPIAIGDKVRLFNRVNAGLEGRKHGYFGDNGTVAEVVSIDQRYGLRLKRADGVIGAVRWKTLQDKDTGRVRLSYGSALTINARQSETLTDHLTLMPEGSRAVDKHTIYSADTRGRENNALIVSHGAEKEEVRNRRPLGDPWLAQASETEMRQAIIDNMARNMSRETEKGLGVDFLDRGLNINYGSINTQQAAWFKSANHSKPATPREAATVEAIRTCIDHSPIKLLPGPEELRQQKRSMRSAAERPKRPKPKQDATRMEAQAEFADALRQSGMRLKGEPVMDGKWHRVPVEGDRGHKMSGRYRGYLDGKPAGFIENFKSGQADRWHSEQPVAQMTAEQIRQREADRMARESERHAAKDRAAMRAATTWASAKPVRQHDYLTRKGVQAHGLRQDTKGNLVVPMRDADGTVRNAQTISPDGEKRFQAGGRKTGLYAQLGDIEPTQPLLIAEGFATAATLREATGMPVVVAFDAGNLQPVAQAIRAKHPDVPMVFAADNDHHLPRRDNPLSNVGKEKAESAAKTVGGIVIVPSFGAVETQPLIEGKTPPTDWNDFAAINGKAKLAAAIDAEFKAKGIIMSDKVHSDEAKLERPRTTQTQRDAARSTYQPTQEQAQQNTDYVQRQQRQEQHDRGMEM